jgi:uncharacterized protein (TIRG00374 family)
MPDELHPRHLAVRVLEVVAVIALVAIAITALPGLGDVKARLADATPVWIVAVGVAEIGSCAGYLLVFRATFCPQMSWGLSYDIAMAELAANSLLPTGGAGGLALGVWALSKAGMATEHIARRTVAFFILTSAPNFIGVVVVGIAMFAGILPNDASAALTLVPALIAGGVILVVWLSPELLRKFGAPLEHGAEDDLGGRARKGIRKGLVAAADGVELAKSLIRKRSFGVVVGSFAYMAFDIAALGFAFASIGPVPSFGVLVLGYLIGQLGNLIPVPGGIGGTEGALVGIFALYGVNVPLAAAAVLIYRLFQLVIPALLGAPAFVMLRRKLMRVDQRALVCVPLAAQVVELPSVDLPARS